MTLTDWMIEGSKATAEMLARADPVKVAARHGFAVETVAFNLRWWRERV